MGKESPLRLNLGDKVRVIQNAYDDEDFWEVLVATTGSIGTIISLEEYFNFADKNPSIYQPRYKYPAIAALIKRRGAYPLRFDSVVPPSAAVHDHWAKLGRQFIVLCEEGGVAILETGIIERA